MAREKKEPILKVVETLMHNQYATRKNIASAEQQPLMQKKELRPVKVSYARGGNGLEAEMKERNPDLDPQLVWRGKDKQDWSDLVVNAPPLYIQEKVHPKALIDDLRQHGNRSHSPGADSQPDLFGDFNGIPEGADKYDFYQHDGKWQNRMILGDSLQVMASLAEREGLRGQVQCIYIDPPYGIKFNSNFQWSTTTREVTDGKLEHLTREPEMVKAFRDTWRDGVHSYLSYLRDRFAVSRDLLHETGSIFVQIGEQNVHRVRALLDEVFGEDNHCSQIFFAKTTGTASGLLPNLGDVILWYAKNREVVKFRPLLRKLNVADEVNKEFRDVRLPNYAYRKLSKEEKQLPHTIPSDWLPFRTNTAVSPQVSPTLTKEITFMCGVKRYCGDQRHWKTAEAGLMRLEKAERLDFTQGATRMYRRFFYDNQYAAIGNVWADTRSEQHQIYVVQTHDEVTKRCILMSTDPGDLVLDPTCGSGTTAYAAEQWGRRWITIDTSRVAMALARSRIMGARYPFYLLSDSVEGQRKEADLQRKSYVVKEAFGNVRHGFVYERAPYVQLSDIARNSEIDLIWEGYRLQMSSHLNDLNDYLGITFKEWEVPVEADPSWSSEAKACHQGFWITKVKRQQEIDASITANAQTQYLYDKPYVDSRKVRVAGPFTVDTLSPHRALLVDENDEIRDPVGQAAKEEEKDFVQMILRDLERAGVQQAHREDKIEFVSLRPWPGHYICAEGTYMEGEKSRRAGVFIGPEFGTVPRPELVAAAREAGEADFDVLISCAFNYEALSTEFDKLGRIPVLKARINADMHMSEELKNTGKGNLFVIFGEPDIDILPAEDGQVKVQLNGVDVFKPNEGRVESSSPNEIACWFIDTDYDEESFFARHAYFLGANDPYKALKATLKAEIDEEAWASLHSSVSRSFNKPESGRIAVKVINHLGDEVMKVFRVAAN